MTGIARIDRRRLGLRWLAMAFATLWLAACNANGSWPFWKNPPEAQPAPPVVDIEPAVAPPQRLSGRVQATSSPPPSAIRQFGNPLPAPVIRPPGPGETDKERDIALNFVETDLREVVRVVLGTLLKVNYIIEPSASGTVTLQTVQPVGRDELLPLLQSVLAESGLSITFRDGLYRIGQLAGAAAVPPLVGSTGGIAGSQVVPLRFASARQLASIIEPYVGESGRVLADSARNLLIITGPSSVRDTVMNLVRIFDVDYLAGQSYALFPVRSGDVKKLALDLQRFLQPDGDTAGSSSVRVLPIEPVNAILVMSTQAALVDRAGRLLDQLDQVGESTKRSARVYFVQNGQAAELQPILQRLFSPRAIQGGGAGQGPGGLPPTAEGAQLNTPPPAAPAASGGTSGRLGASSSGSAGKTGGASASQPAEATAAAPPADLEPSTQQGGDSGIRIISDRKRNALVILATDDEYAMIEATLRRLDVLPLQVLIEATIAEVTLNDSLKYGTQYFFKTAEANVLLSNAKANATTIPTDGSLSNSSLFPGLFTNAAPAFAITRTLGNVQYAIQALKSLTDVKVVSSPSLLILDNERARLQVGDLVPVITQSATSTSSANAPTVNSVEYRETGVILTVTPRINSGGLVTLDLEQEVSDVVRTTSSTIDSPTFQQRKIKSSIVIQDGETVGLAGLIRDKQTRDNSGIPYLKDIPVLGALFGTTNNSGERTELLVLITPRVVRDQRTARALTEDLKRKLTPTARQLLVPMPAEP